MLPSRVGGLAVRQLAEYCCQRHACLPLRGLVLPFLDRASSIGPPMLMQLSGHMPTVAGSSALYSFRAILERPANLRVVFSLVGLWAGRETSWLPSYGLCEALHPSFPQTPEMSGSHRGNFWRTFGTFLSLDGRPR